MVSVMSFIVYGGVSDEVGGSKILIYFITRSRRVL